MSKLQALMGLLAAPTEEESIAVEPAIVKHSGIANISHSASAAPILISINQIKRSPFQPRAFFNPDKIEKMASAFRKYKEQGSYPKTAILVRPSSEGYELVFGEQRKLAHEKAGFTDILAFVESLSDSESCELALTENILREDLNPVEKTEAILSFAAIRLDLSPDEVKKQIDRAANERKRGTVNVTRTSQWQALESLLQELPDKITPESFRTNYPPILNLPEEILDALRQGHLEYTKARAIARVKDDDQRSQLLQAAIEQNLSVRQIQAQINALKQPTASGNNPQTSVPFRLKQLSRQLQRHDALKNPKQEQRIQALLDKLEKILEE